MVIIRFEMVLSDLKLCYINSIEEVTLASYLTVGLLTWAKHVDEPTRNITSLMSSDTRILKSPKSSPSSGTPSCKIK